MNCFDLACSFRDFVPFLQLAFGVNVLFGAWDGIYGNVSRFQQESETSDNSLLELVDAGSDLTMALDQQRKECDATMKRCHQIGRWGGLVIASLIALALLTVSHATPLGPWWLMLVAVSGFAMPVLMLFMFFAGRRCTNHISHETNRITRKLAEEAARVKDGARDLARGIQPDNGC